MWLIFTLITSAMKKEKMTHLINETRKLENIFNIFFPSHSISNQFPNLINFISEIFLISFFSSIITVLFNSWLHYLFSLTSLPDCNLSSWSSHGTTIFLQCRCDGVTVLLETIYGSHSAWRTKKAPNPWYWWLSQSSLRLTFQIYYIPPDPLHPGL